MENNNLKFKIIFVLIFFAGILMLPRISWAADFYVSPTGTASWANCTNIDTPCSLATGNCECCLHF